MSSLRKQIVIALASHFQGEDYPFDLDCVWHNYGGMTRKQARQFVVDECKRYPGMYKTGGVGSGMHLSLTGFKMTVLFANREPRNLHRKEDLIATFNFAESFFDRIMVSRFEPDEELPDLEDYFYAFYEQLEYEDELDREPVEGQTVLQLNI